jgi:hypothetical protein
MPNSSVRPTSQGSRSRQTAYCASSPATQRPGSSPSQRPCPLASIAPSHLTEYAACVANLVLGPVLRHVGFHDATVWVETDRPCTVGILGSKARTFEISNHHYGLVTLAGLVSGERYEYTVELDGDAVWPDPAAGYPPSSIATLREGRPVRLIFGSCRLAYPHTRPFTLAPHQHEVGRGVDALTAFGEQLRHLPPDQRPDLILHLGDQVYSDELPLSMHEYVHQRRRHLAGPENEVVDFEEYTQLYKTSWSEPTLR